MINRSRTGGVLSQAPDRAPAAAGAAPSGGPLGKDRIEQRGLPPRRVGLFWQSEGLAPPTAAFRGSGAQVAAVEWVRALATHGSLAHLDMFAPLTSLKRCREQFYGMSAEARAKGAPEVRMLPQSAALGCGVEHGYDALHTPTDMDLTAPSFARSRLGSAIFPITASQMGISYSFQIELRFIRLLTAAVAPCDAIVCSTACSRRAMEQRMLRVAETYSAAWGATAPRLPRLELIPWGVDTERFAPSDKAAARRHLGLPLDRPILLCVARVRVQDKMDWTPLFLALQRLNSSVGRPPLLLICGAALPEYADYLISQAAQLDLTDSVTPFFNPPAACLPMIYNACDVFVSPADSPSESFGLTIAEAMACGRPVVASDWDGYKDLVAHGETGYRVRTDWADCLGELERMGPVLEWDQQHLHVGQSVSVDVSQLAGRLSYLLNNPDAGMEMGRRGRMRAETLYAWPVVIRQWEELWAELGGVARSLERCPPDHLNYLMPCYFPQFCHYASRIIDDATPVQLTSRGSALLAGKAPLLLHPWARGFLQPQHLQATLAALKPAGWARADLLVGQVVRVVQKAHGLSRDSALMHLMWLAKYDLVELGGTNPPLPTALGE